MSRWERGEVFGRAGGGFGRCWLAKGDRPRLPVFFGGYRVVGGLLPPGGDGERMVSLQSGAFGTVSWRNEIRIARLRFFSARMRME